MNFVNLFLFIFSLSASSAHEFHVSKCLIKYNEASSSLEISMHIFLDDLEDALEINGIKNLYLCTENEAVGAEDHIVAYLARQFQVKLNGIDLELNFIGKELSDDLAAVWCYLEIYDITPEGELEISNEILFDLFDDQKNITSVKLPSGNEYFLFQKGDSTEKLKF